MGCGSRGSWMRRRWGLAPGRSYTVRVSAPSFHLRHRGRRFVKVPTAKLSVAAVDDYGKPNDIYVTEVRLGLRRG